VSAAALLEPAPDGLVGSLVEDVVPEVTAA